MAVMTRGALYRRIDAMRTKYGLCGRFDPFAFAEACGIPIVYHPFTDERLHGVLVRSGKAAGIVLDPRLTPEQQRYTLTHELVHMELHYGENSQTFQDHSGMEYQADEGAAELLMPYRDFIPRVASFRRRFLQDPVSITTRLAAHYRVDCEMIRKRLHSLDHELMLYYHGVPLSEILPRSEREKRQRGISSKQFDHPTKPISGKRPDIFPEDGKENAP